MPAKKRIKKQTKKTVKKSNSSKKRATKKTNSKRVSKKTVKKTKTVKKSPKKKTVKKTSSRKKSTSKKTTKKTSRKANSRKKASRSTSTPVKTSSDKKFDLLLEELKSLKNNNLELSKKIVAIQNQQDLKQNPTNAQIGQDNFQKANDEELKRIQNSKDELLNQIKKLISKKNREEENNETNNAEENIRYNESLIKPPIVENTISDKDASIQFVADSEENPNFPRMEKKVIDENRFRPDSKQEFNKYQEEYQDQEIHKNNKSNFQETIVDVNKEDFQTDKKRGIITIEEAKNFSVKLKDLQKEINKVFIGQEEVVENVIISLICDAHTLLEGVPGLAKSLLIETFGKTISGTTFERIQFLPDLLPADIIGGQIFNPKTAEFITKKGPIFANFVLADEINRAPPKTHAAVMEAMQEKKINIENEEFILDRPFLVLATQNPLENKGTYQLPEAVLDRFMFKVILDYPKRSDEFKIITDNATTKKNLQKKIRMVLSKKEILEIQQKVKNVFISDKIREYILDLVEATRGVNKNIQGVKFLKYGAGVRASIYLGIAAKARALMEGRNYVLPDDVYHVVPNIFRHRLSLNYKGKAHNISTDRIIEEILKKVNPI